MTHGDGQCRAQKPRKGSDGRRGERADDVDAGKKDDKANVKEGVEEDDDDEDGDVGLAKELRGAGLQRTAYKHGNAGV